MVEYEETSVFDLVKYTMALHKIKPSLQDKLVFAIQKPQPGDRNVIFHLMNRVAANDDEDEETEIFMISPDYLLEYFGIKDDTNDESTGKTEEESS